MPRRRLRPARSSLTAVLPLILACAALISLVGARAQSTVVFSDDFNDNTRDPSKWNLGVLTQPSTSFDSQVAVREQNQELEITPRSNVNGHHFNGYVSASAFDLTGRRATVEARQVPAGAALGDLAVGVDSNNWYRISTLSGKIFFEDTVAGAKHSTNVAYSATQHHYWRIRHDGVKDQILFETSSDNVTWTTRRTIARQLNIKALRVELNAGTSSSLSNPGKAVFDNFVLDSATVSPTPTPTPTATPTPTPTPTPSPSPTPLCNTPTTGLLDWYAAEGNGNDSAGTNNATLQGVTFITGEVGQAFAFNGTSDAVLPSTALHTAFTSLSVDAWVNPTAYGHDSSGTYGQTVFSNTDGDGFALRLMDGYVQADLRLASGNLLQTFSQQQVPLNSWSHVALTYDGTTVTAYLDGQPLGSVQTSGGAVRNAANAGTCPMIGNEPSGCSAQPSGFGFAGGVDELDFFNRALSASEVLAIYNAGAAGKCQLGSPTPTPTPTATPTPTPTPTTSPTPTPTPGPSPTPGVVNGFSDDFNDNTRDPSKWSVGIFSKDSSQLDPLVQVLEQNGQLQIKPLANITGLHYDGYESVRGWDMTGGAASVEAVQMTNGPGTSLVVGLDYNDWYRISFYGGTLYFQDQVGGTSGAVTATYNATQHRFWRIRHDATTDQIVFETSADRSTWMTQRSIARQLPITALMAEMSAGTYELWASPGTAIFDNFQLQTRTPYWAKRNEVVNDAAGHTYSHPQPFQLDDGELIAGFSTDEDAKGFEYKLVRSTDGGQTWGSKVTIESTGVDTYEGGFAQTSATNLVVAYGVGDGVGVRRSSDRGQTWSSEITVAPAGGGDDCHPSMTKLAGGALLVAYRYQGKIIAKKSTDGGATWGSAITVASSSTQVYHSPSVVAMPSGDLVVAFAAGPTGGSSVRVTRSTNAGGTWGTPALVTAAAQGGFNDPNLTVLNSGDLVLWFVDGVPTTGARSDSFRLSHDEGQTWSCEGPVYNDSDPHRMNAIQLGDGSMLVVCASKDGGDNNYHIDSLAAPSNWPTSQCQ